MRRFLIPMTLAVAVVSFAEAALDACGAKFLVATSAVMWQRTHRSTRPANILIYQHNRETDVVEFVTKLQGMLKGVGHKVTIAAGVTELRGAANGKFNVVMLGLDQARQLKADIKSALPDAAILPMDAFTTQPVEAAAKAEFGRLLVLPATTKDVYSAVEALAR